MGHYYEGDRVDPPYQPFLNMLTNIANELHTYNETARNVLDLQKEMLNFWKEQPQFKPTQPVKLSDGQSDLGLEFVAKKPSAMSEDEYARYVNAFKSGKIHVGDMWVTMKDINVDPTLKGNFKEIKKHSWVTISHHHDPFMINLHVVEMNLCESMFKGTVEMKIADFFDHIRDESVVIVSNPIDK